VDQGNRPPRRAEIVYRSHWWLSIPPGGLLAQWHSVLQIRNSMTASAATVHHGCWAWWFANKTGGVASVVY
jgi:hypothetical protein